MRAGGWVWNGGVKLVVSAWGKVALMGKGEWDAFCMYPLVLEFLNSEKISRLWWRWKKTGM